MSLWGGNEYDKTFFWNFVEILVAFSHWLYRSSFFTKSPIFNYILLIFAVPFLLLFFSPFLIQLFAPAFFLFSSLANHFKETKNMPFEKKYLFIPMALLSAVIFILAQTILSIWVFVVSFITWADLIGAFLATLLIFSLV